jgi:nuclear GTP-binding protein
VLLLDHVWGIIVLIFSSSLLRGENFYRDAKSARRVKLLAESGPTRNAEGEVIKAAAFQNPEAKPGRVQPDRRWFGNTRVISQDALDHFRTTMGSRVNDPYAVLLRRNKLPMSLLQEGTSTKASGKNSSLTAVESYSQTFGPSAQRKRPRMDNALSSFEELAASSEKAGIEAEERERLAQEKASGVGLVPADAEIGSREGQVSSKEIYSMPVTRGRSEPIYSKGQSRRIWAELYKVIDSSDVVIHVLDVRDPLGTRCRSVEKHLREEKPHKHLVFLLNKVDLVPTWVSVSVSSLSPFPFLSPHNHVKARATFNGVNGLLRMWKMNGVDAVAFIVGSFSLRKWLLAQIAHSSPAIEEGSLGKVDRWLSDFWMS